MRPRPRQDPILNRDLTAAAAGAVLRRRLAPERWPVPPAALPPDAVLVGGAVRDAALGRLEACPDLDLVVGEDAIATCRQLARRSGGSCVVLDAERDMARLVVGGWTIDLARRQGPDLVSDLRRRDYTVNAIALPLAEGLGVADPTGGLPDLQRRRLAAVSEANLQADPLRLLRGVRLATELEFALTAETGAWIERHGPRLAAVAAERVLAELEKLALAPRGEQGLALALRLGLLGPWRVRPAAPVGLAQLNRDAAAARGLQGDEIAAALPLARLAWLLDGTAVARLKGSRRLQQRCSALREGWTLLAGRSLEALAEPERLELHERLDRDLPALLLARPPQEARLALARWRDPADPLFHPRPPLDGQQLQQSLGVPPGPELGALLQHLKRERAFGRLAGQSDQAAVASARHWLEHRTPAP